MTASSPPLIYVWLGTTLPTWAELSLSITRLFNPSLKIYLISDHIHAHSYLSRLSISTIVHDNVFEDLPIAYSTSDNLYRFWQSTSKRFFHLYHFAETSCIPAFFHAELDNIVFDISNLHLLLDERRGFFAPQDSPSRAIGSFTYTNYLESLRELLLCFSQKHVNNDMDALGLFASNSTLFHSLPTESSFASTVSWSPLSPDHCHGLFDAAAIGQYLFGIPKYHTPYRPSLNQFVNENCLIDLSKLSITSLFPLVLDHPIFPKPLTLYNLHVHSKQFRFIHSLFFHDRFTKPFNKGKPVTLSRYYMHTLGPLRRITKPFCDITKARLQRLFRLLFHVSFSLTK